MTRSAPAPKSSSSRGLAIGAGLVVGLVVVAGWWFWPRTSRVTETATIAKSLLDSGGTPDKRAIRQVIQNVDRMPRAELFTLYRAVGEEWRRLRQESIDRYFSATAAEKPQILDAEMARLESLHELMLALNPDADPNGTPWMPRERGRGGRRGRGGNAEPQPQDEAAAKAEADRRAIAERYEEALLAHAKSRGVELPAFR